MLLDKTRRRRRSTNVGVAQPAEVLDHPLESGEVLVGSLRDLVGVVPYLCRRRVQAAHSAQVSALDRTEQTVGNLVGFFRTNRWIHETSAIRSCRGACKL